MDYVYLRVTDKTKFAKSQGIDNHMKRHWNFNLLTIDAINRFTVSIYVRHNCPLHVDLIYFELFMRLTRTSNVPRKALDKQSRK